MAKPILSLNPNSRIYDAIIIGAGAAGLFCAGQLAQKGKKVLLLEKNEKIGAKILISGGGRCNFTNLEVSHKNFVSNNPHFSISALKQFTPNDFIELVKANDIPFTEKTLGQLFVDKQGGAKDIINMLLGLCISSKVNIKNSCEINKISKKDNFIIETNLGEFEGRNLIIATGGKSIPKLGATGFAFDIAKQFGVNIIDAKAGLVPLVFTGKKYEWMHSLAGTAFTGKVSANGISFNEAILFTHKGLSGPAILQISNYLNQGDEIYIDFAPNQNLHEYFIAQKSKQPKKNIGIILSQILPQRLANKLVEINNIDKQMQNFKNQELFDLAELLHKFPLNPAGDEGYYKAEVMRGGIDTDDINQKTFETKKIKSLYFIGECLDVTGQLGGYNFQWAWSSAYACAMGIN